MSGEEMNPRFDETIREKERALDREVVAALERVPDDSPTVPVDFAARVAASVPLRPAVVVRASRWGRTMMWICLVVSLLVLAVATRWTAESVAATTVVWTLYLESLAIAVWLGVQRWRAN